MAKDYALMMQALKTPTWWDVRSNTSQRKGGGSFLSRCHFIAEATSPVRSEKKEQEHKPTTPARSEQ